MNIYLTVKNELTFTVISIPPRQLASVGLLELAITGNRIRIMRR